MPGRLLSVEFSLWNNAGMASQDENGAPVEGPCYATARISTKASQGLSSRSRQTESGPMLSPSLLQGEDDSPRQPMQ